MENQNPTTAQRIYTVRLHDTLYIKYRLQGIRDPHNGITHIHNPEALRTICGMPLTHFKFAAREAVADRQRRPRIGAPVCPICLQRLAKIEQGKAAATAFYIDGQTDHPELCLNPYPLTIAGEAWQIGYEEIREKILDLEALREELAETQHRIRHTNRVLGRRRIYAKYLTERIGEVKTELDKQQES